MEVSGAGKAPNTSLSFRYNANNEELEELFDVCDEEPPSPPFDSSPTVRSETESPKKPDRTPSIIDKYFKSMRSDKTDKLDDKVDTNSKASEEIRNSPKDVQSSPMKEYLKSLGKKNNSEPAEVKEGSNETWKIFHDFKFKIAQAVEDMKTRSSDDTREKSVPRDNSISDSEENSIIKDSDQSVGDTDNQVSSIESSLQNLSEMSQPVTAKATEREVSPTPEKNNSDSSDDTHKNLDLSETGGLVEQKMVDPQLEIESGVEALEDEMEGFSEVNPTSDPSKLKQSDTPDANIRRPLTPLKTSSQQPPSNTSLWRPRKEIPNKPKTYLFNFTLCLVTFLLVANYIILRKWMTLNGFLLGIWTFCFISSLKQWFCDNYFYETINHRQSSEALITLKRSSAAPFTYTIPSVREHTPIKKFEGWVNHYRYPTYDPCTYHLNNTTTAFMKLEGCNLRISYTKTKVSKRCTWDEKIEKVEFYQHRLYNLNGARVILLPRGLVTRRTWSKKYPICIILSLKEKIRVLENKSAAERRAAEIANMVKREILNFEIEKESTETSTTPEKKRKFIWRRRDKGASITADSNDCGKESNKDQHLGKEGLRHRLVRKMHRDKKTDSLCTVVEGHSNTDKATHDEGTFHDAETEPSSKEDAAGTTEDDIDESEMASIKEFLDEAELETGALSTSAEGEWNIHVKQFKDKQAHLFIFARSGRDKHEWFRRLSKAVAEKKPPTPEPSTSDEKQLSSDGSENKNDAETTSLRTNVDNEVSYSKTSLKDSLDSSEKVTFNASISTPPPNPLTTDENETVFWPYLIKIIESSKNAPEPGCDCRLLPAGVTWMNTMIARIAYDLMRNEPFISRLQIRIQKKLNTLKIPSFMSPLVVTELSLVGACPLIERVSPPTWDERGVWLDMDLRYEGGAYIAISTQINLLKLKEKSFPLEELSQQELLEPLEETGCGSSPYLYSECQMRGSRHSKAAVYDSDVEDSGESSTDEESPSLQRVDSFDELDSPSDSNRTSTVIDPAVSSKKKFLRIVDRIATNKYFQQVTDYKYVKRAMEGLSNTDIKLQLECHGLEGRLVVNLPPPPHDRIWIGFRPSPQLVLKARPAVGARTLKFGHISNWIEQRLAKEFDKVLVMPNMEDFAVDLMAPTPIDYE